MTTQLRKIEGFPVVVKVTLDADGKMVGFPITYTAETVARMKAGSDRQVAEIAAITALLEA